ncbi:MAG: glycosyltransferase family 2 protein [Mesorhizobium sp.]|uniref:glycosyltransferase family 2 protein n=1 Tax=Mesorhizobium sp. TaxID=1871066 RepID=UPI001ACC10CB|nr:glycosyltransferase family A protein [Mesorhizobium sp.]MBN9220409.1 glycosyltransferase family 2 protein [Mesorhizobium sp.]
MNYSVVIPHGKKAHNLAKAIQSIKDQTLPASAIVVVCNNGISLAETKCHLDDIERDDVVLFDFQSARTANEARNRGAFETTTGWIAFLDSDDTWLPRYAEVANNLISAHQDAEFIYGSYEYFRADGDRRVCLAYPVNRHKTVQEYILRGGSTTTCSMIVKRSLFASVQWDAALKRHQDWDYFVRLYEAAKLSLPVEEPLISVDWTNGTAHRHHAACISVTKGWVDKVPPKLFLRYLASQAVGSIRSRDFSGLVAVSTVLPSAIFRFVASAVSAKE